jgi:ethanolamine utilization protein EutQ (cupin superfamily)
MDISKNTQHIKAIIEAMRKERRLKKGLEKAQITALWKELMGETIDNYTNSLTYDSGILTVYLNSSAMREELNRGKNKIIDLLNSHFNERIIKQIIFK